MASWHLRLELCLALCVDSKNKKESTSRRDALEGWCSYNLYLKPKYIQRVLGHDLEKLCIFPIQSRLSVSNTGFMSISLLSVSPLPTCRCTTSAHSWFLGHSISIPCKVAFCYIHNTKCNGIYLYGVIIWKLTICCLYLQVIWKHKIFKSCPPPFWYSLIT